MTALAEPTPVRVPLRSRMQRRLAEPLLAFRAIARNRALRRLEYAWVGSVIGQWAYTVALGVYAYRVGGATAVGLAGLLRTIPTILGGAFIGSLGDHYKRVHVMVAADLTRATLFGAGAICIAADGPPGIVYAIAGLVMLCGSAFRPAQSALLPALTRTPEELTAMNVVSSTVESVGFFVGPALGGLLLAATNPQTVFAASAATCLWSATMLVGPALRAADTRPERQEPEGGAADKRSALSESVEGFRTIGRDRKLFMLVSLFTAQTLVAGALNVFIVVLALRLYDSGPSGVGTLNAAVGVGGILGAAAAAALVGGNRLARGFAFGLVMWGAPLMLVGGVPWEVIGLIGLAAIGLANTVIDVSAFTLLQRAVPDEVLARVFGVLESVLIGGMGIGALLTPVVIHALGIRGALLAVGGSLPLLTLLTWSRLRVLDDGAGAAPERIALLKSLPLFRPLPIPTIESLAARLEERDVASGEVVIREGDAGDRFYVVRDGTFNVVCNGEQSAVLGPGDFFGEIALLRECARTATVAADGGPGVLYSLTREDFVPAMRIELLKSLPLFRPLPLATTEFLASRLERREVEPGEVVVRQGDAGDRFYVIGDGEFTVLFDGEPGATLGPGDFFGEIALLRDVPRTATVVASGVPGVVYSLTRDDFVPAVTGCVPSNAEADQVVGARLAQLSRPAALR